MTTLADQQAVLDAAAGLARTFGHLPAASIHVDLIDPGWVMVAIHDDLPAFEAWREALGVEPSDVEFGLFVERGHMILEARTRFMGAEIEVHGYAPVLTGQGVTA
ncbi:hypothetical protein AB0B15_14235 [Streptomyces sp. NPDC045456]|uniref:hypothetical protein n=1 Tax=Streptomyces sp. NPDC045456 TaxID=3155254 RepID=UPI0033F6A680